MTMTHKSHLHHHRNHHHNNTNTVTQGGQKKLVPLKTLTFKLLESMLATYFPMYLLSKLATRDSNMLTQTICLLPQ